MFWEVGSEILLISSPFNIPVGGFIREYNVIPILSKKLSTLGYKPILYIPVTSLVSLYKYTQLAEGYTTAEGTGKLFLEVLKQNLADIIRKSDKNLEIILPSFSIEERKSLSKGIRKDIIPSSVSSLIRHIYNILNEFNSEFTIRGLLYKRKNIGLTYITHETPESFYLGMKVSKETRSSIAFLFHHLESFHLGHTLYSQRASKEMTSTFETLIIGKLVKYMVGKSNITLLNAISPEIALFRDELSKLFGYPLINILDPPNAITFDFIKPYKVRFCKNVEKGIKYIYYGRLSFEKGIRDLLISWKKISEINKDSSLTLIGPINDERVKRFLVSFLRSNNIRNVHIRGVVSRKELLREQLESHVLLYPSYIDGFSFSVLESIATGLLTVAYNIPAINYHYRGVKSVFKVPVGNLEEFVKTAIILSKRYSVFCEKVESYSEIISSFLDKYSSWDKVVESELKGILKAIQRVGVRSK